MKLVNCTYCKRRHLLKNSKSFPEIKTVYDGEKVIDLSRTLYFCSLECEIKYMINEHRELGMNYDMIFEHLIDIHLYKYDDVEKILKLYRSHKKGVYYG